MEKEGLTKTVYSARVEDAWTALHVIVQDKAKEVRQEFLEDKYQEAMVKRDKPKAAIIKLIKEAEYMNRLCPRLRKYSKQEIPSGRSHIEIPVYDKQGEISEFRSVTEPSENFSHLIRRNSDHFFQAKSSPFVEGIFGQDLPPFQQNDFS